MLFCISVKIEIPCRTRRLIFNPTNLFSLTITSFHQRFAADPHNFLVGFWSESNLTTLLKVLPADLLQAGLVVGDVAHVALLLLAVGALHDGVRLHGLDQVLLGHTQLA